MDLTLTVESVNTSGTGRGKVRIEIGGAEREEILNAIPLEDIVYHFDDDKILDHIGVDRVKEYFDLKEVSE